MNFYLKGFSTFRLVPRLMNFFIIINTLALQFQIQNYATVSAEQQLHQQPLSDSGGHFQNLYDNFLSNFKFNTALTSAMPYNFNQQVVSMPSNIIALNSNSNSHSTKPETNMGPMSLSQMKEKVYSLGGGPPESVNVNGVNGNTNLNANPVTVPSQSSVSQNQIQSQLPNQNLVNQIQNQAFKNDNDYLNAQNGQGLLSSHIVNDPPSSVNLYGDNQIFTEKQNNNMNQNSDSDSKNTGTANTNNVNTATQVAPGVNTLATTNSKSSNPNLNLNVKTSATNTKSTNSRSRSSGHHHHRKRHHKKSEASDSDTDEEGGSEDDDDTASSESDSEDNVDDEAESEDDRDDRSSNNNNLAPQNQYQPGPQQQQPQLQYPPAPIIVYPQNPQPQYGPPATNVGPYPTKSQRQTLSNGLKHHRRHRKSKSYLDDDSDSIFDLHNWYIAWKMFYSLCPSWILIMTAFVGGGCWETYYFIIQDSGTLSNNSNSYKAKIIDKFRTSQGRGSSSTGNGSGFNNLTSQSQSDSNYINNMQPGVSQIHGTTNFLSSIYKTVSHSLLGPDNPLQVVQTSRSGATASSATNQNQNLNHGGSFKRNSNTSNLTSGPKHFNIGSARSGLGTDPATSKETAASGKQNDNLAEQLKAAHLLGPHNQSQKLNLNESSRNTINSSSSKALSAKWGRFINSRLWGSGGVYRGDNDDGSFNTSALNNAQALDITVNAPGFTGRQHHTSSNVEQCQPGPQATSPIQTGRSTARSNQIYQNLSPKRSALKKPKSDVNDSGSGSSSSATSSTTIGNTDLRNSASSSSSSASSSATEDVHESNVDVDLHIKNINEQLSNSLLIQEAAFSPSNTSLGTSVSPNSASRSPVLRSALRSSRAVPTGPGANQNGQEGGSGKPGN